jgi:hypothetical protein
MGMYTEIMFRADLVADVPDDVIDVLRVMTGEISSIAKTPSHPLFEEDRWDILGTGSSAYFPGGFRSRVSLGFYSGQWTVALHGNIKNYGSEIEKFFDWIDPYVDGSEGDFLGYSLYEENDVPTMYFKKAQQPT